MSFFLKAIGSRIPALMTAFRIEPIMVKYYKFKRITIMSNFKSVAIIVALIFSLPSKPGLAATQPDGNWKDIQNKGTTALDANEYWIAEPLLMQAMAQAEHSQPKDLRLAKSLAELGRLYTIRGRFPEAEAYLEEELSVREMVLGNDRYKCIPTMGSLIQFYLKYGTQAKAKPLAEEMLSLVEGKVEEARSGSFKVKLKKGEPLQGWLGVASPVARDPILDWAITCDAVGNCYRSVNNFDMADRFFRAALDVKTTVLGNNHLSLANSYDSLGALYFEKKDFAEADSYFTDALRITERTLSPESPEGYNRLDKLAKCLIKEGKYQQAEELYLKAQHFWPDEPEHYGSLARNLLALGCLYNQQHKYEAAAPCLEKALRLAEQSNGSSSIALVPYLQNYAYTQYYLGHKPEMEQLHARSDAISGPNIPEPKIAELKANIETLKSEPNAIVK